MTGADEAPKSAVEESAEVTTSAPTVEAPLRVLHVYSGNLYGGVETFLRTLAEERAQCPEMEPEFALCFEGRLADELRAAGAPLHMLGGVRLSRPWQVLRAQARLRRLIRKRRPDVVVCHAVWPYVLFGPVLRAIKTRLVFYQHDIGEKRAPLNLMAALIRPDVYIANSKYTAAHAHPQWRGVEPQVVYPAVHVPNARLSAEERRSLRAELCATDDDIVILQPSRMQAWKGHYLLLDALALLPPEVRWKCWMAGGVQRPEEAAYMDELKAHSIGLAIASRVTFLGDRRDLFRLMQAADLVCQPNLAPEPYGIALAEARAAERPILTTNVAGGALEQLPLTITAPPPQAPAVAKSLLALLLGQKPASAAAEQVSGPAVETKQLLARLAAHIAIAESSE